MRIPDLWLYINTNYKMWVRGHVVAIFFIVSIDILIFIKIMIMTRCLYHNDYDYNDDDDDDSFMYILTFACVNGQFWLLFELYFLPSVLVSGKKTKIIYTQQIHGCESNHFVMFLLLHLSKASANRGIHTCGN